MCHGLRRRHQAGFIQVVKFGVLYVTDCCITHGVMASYFISVLVWSNHLCLRHWRLKCLSSCYFMHNVSVIKSYWRRHHVSAHFSRPKERDLKCALERWGVGQDRKLSYVCQFQRWHVHIFEQDPHYPVFLKKKIL